MSGVSGSTLSPYPTMGHALPVGKSEWDKAYVTYQGNEYDFPIHKPTGEVYASDSKNIVRFKCVLLSFAMLVKAPFRIFKELGLVIATIAEQKWTSLKGKVSKDEADNSINKSLKSVQRVIDSHLGMMGAAFYGIVSPYEGRRVFGAAERDFLEDPQGPHHKSQILEGNEDKDTPKMKKKRYTAFCFQYLEKQTFKAGESGIEGSLLKKHLDFVNRNSVRKVRDLLALSGPKKYDALSRAALSVSHYVRKITLKGYETIPSVNIARADIVDQCFYKVMMPDSIDKEIGKFQGLRITHGLAYLPTEGLCLGMSLSFLKSMMENLHLTAEQRIRKAASLFIEGAPEESLKNQAIYEALRGDVRPDLKGRCPEIPEQEFSAFADLLHAAPTMQNFFENLSPTKKALWKSIEAFKKRENPLPTDSLRAFVLGDLELKNVSLTNAIYRFTLTLDELFSGNSQYQVDLEMKATTALAESQKLKVIAADSFKGKKSEAFESLKKIPAGHYMIQIQNPYHTIAYVKNEDGTGAIFDAIVGTVLMKFDCDAIVKVLERYSKNNEIDFKLIAMGKI